MSPAANTGPTPDPAGAVGPLGGPAGAVGPPEAPAGSGAPPGHPARTAGPDIVVLAYPGCDELDLFGAYSVLVKAAALGQGLRVRLAAREPRVTGSGGATVASAAPLGAVEAADAVVVPGGRGAEQACADEPLLAALRAAAARGAALYAVCSGALLVAAAGLADGRRVAVHHGKRALLRRHPVGEVVAGLTRDGRLCTVGGDRRESVKSVDLAFALLADLAPDAVEAVGARMELRPGRLSVPVPVAGTS